MRSLLVAGLLFASLAPAQNALYLDISKNWLRTLDDRPWYAKADFPDNELRNVDLPLPLLLRPDQGKFYWLRRKVELPSGTDRRQLTLTLGSFDRVYEVYVNGVRIGGTPGMDVSTFQISRPRTFAIPAEVASRTGPLQIAVRTGRPTGTLRLPWLNVPEGPYLMTYGWNAPKGLGESSINAHSLRNAPYLITSLIEILLGIFILFLGTEDRFRRKFYWLTAFLWANGAAEILQFMQIGVDTYPMHLGGQMSRIGVALDLAVYAEFAMSALGMRMRWAMLGIWITTFALLLQMGLDPADSNLFPLTRVLGALTLAIILWTWWKICRVRTVRPHHLFVATLAFTVLVLINRHGSDLGFNPRWLIGHYWWPNSQIMIVLLAVAMLVQMLRQLAADRKEKQRLAGELEAARTVQQMLFASTPGVDAVYEPAQEVGGDFYFAAELADRGQLVVVGDVSGKGLKAAMLVSTITGALRNRHNDDPAALLLELNRVLLGGSGFVTAVIAKVRSDGSVMLANAGNPAPYLSCEEVALPAGLPLGVDAEASYESVQLQLSKEQTLTFVSDGVVEAANVQGELFGFERAREISSQSPAEIARAAQAWGQNDDITVVRVRRKS